MFVRNLTYLDEQEQSLYFQGKGAIRTYWLVGKRDYRRPTTLGGGEIIPSITEMDNHEFSSINGDSSLEISRRSNPLDPGNNYEQNIHQAITYNNNNLFHNGVNNGVNNNYRRQSAIGQTIILGRAAKFSQKGSGGEVDVGDSSYLLADEQVPEVETPTALLSNPQFSTVNFLDDKAVNTLDNINSRLIVQELLPSANNNLVPASETPIINSGSCFNLFHDYKRAIKDLNPRRPRCVGPNALQGFWHGPPFRLAGDKAVAVGYRSAPIISLRDKSSPKDFTS